MRVLLGKPAECFANMHGMGGGQPQFESVRALNELNLEEGSDKSFQGLHEQCGAGHPKACMVAGLMAMEGQGGAKQDLQQAFQLLSTACAGKMPKACFFQGRLQDGLKGLDGQGLAPDAGKAHEKFREACAGGVGEGCYNVAQMLDSGRVVDGEEKKLHARVAKVWNQALNIPFSMAWDAWCFPQGLARGPAAFCCCDIMPSPHLRRQEIERLLVGKRCTDASSVMHLG